MKKSNYDWYGMEGYLLKVGDRVVYGRSNRDKPLAIGVITAIDDIKITILREGATQKSYIPTMHVHRILLLGTAPRRKKYYEES